MAKKAFDGVFTMPIGDRTAKPRKYGFTMVLDKNLGIEGTKDIIRLGKDYIDDVKITFGTGAFYDEDLLQEKIKLLRDNDIDCMPGGTFFEVAIWQGTVEKWLDRAKDIGFNVIELSDGTLDFDLEVRKRMLTMATGKGFKVLTEVGKKDPTEKPDFKVMHQQIKQDLENGAYKVIIEAREAGKGVGIFDKDGKPMDEEIEGLVEGVDDINDLIWEAPLKNQQQYLILRFGSNVSLGNVEPGDIIALEALRCGLRGDTLKQAWIKDGKKILS